MIVILIFTTTNLLHVYYGNLASYETLKNKDIVITKSDKGNRVVIFDKKILS